MFCSECGNKLETGERFCGKCGTKVLVEPVKSLESKKNKWIIAVVCVIAVAAVLGIGATLLLNNKDEENMKTEIANQQTELVTNENAIDENQEATMLI